ncbi:MAG: NADH dehydrogenase [Ruminococcaceae bacterium]|nr:NADH dehydrogenase [Oscillospiraceae bacterium]
MQRINLLLPVLVFFPMLAAVVTYFVGRNKPALRSGLVVFTALAELALTVLCAVKCMGSVCDISACRIGLEMDGFRAIYACIVAFMWAMTALFSPEYFAHYHRRSRYYFFFLMTLGATMGVFLSSDLMTTLLFFEVMSFTSYAWVAHDESTKAKRAANTYLAIAVIGGMVALMGLFLLDHSLGTLKISELYAAASALEDRSVLYIAGGCLLFGFGAKAGMFPLHIWLPKAHPVAPAPASALLSGVLTKTGIFGVLVVSCDILRYDAAWGNVILLLGTITMVLGAVLALFSIDLKRTLACSSMSQIGFILIGIAMQCLLGEENALAANGTMLHMINHSLIKLDLFMVAGVVYMNTHRLDLNSIRGWGKDKPLLNIAFLLGLLGIGGVPLFNGYISKTLLHESIVEYAHHSGSGIITAIESIFLISGGITLAYMTKLYVCIFIEGKKPEKTDKKYMSPMSAAAIMISALTIPVLGALPHLTQDKLAALGTPFMAGGELHHEVEYFSLVNLKGAAISLVIAAVLYFVIVRRVLAKKNANGQLEYLDLWPQKLDLEDGFYRPLLLRWLVAPCGSNGTKPLEAVVAFISSIPDGIVWLLRKTIYKDSPFTPHEHKKYGFAHSFGSLLDKLRGKRHPVRKGEKSYAELMTDVAVTISRTSKGIEGNFSFALLMACVGICAAIIYLLFIVG